MARTWQVRGTTAPVKSLEALRKRLLKNLGLSAGESERFFSPVYERDIHDPLTELSDIGLAADRVYQAVDQSEKILVYGDYDADGIASCAILLTVLQELGAHVTPFLPDREAQGYGLHQPTLLSLTADINLVITCDCGIANADEITWLAGRGIDTIVVDHHALPEDLPAAYAIVHPRHPARSYVGGDLCGAGVSWKLASALLRDRRSPHAGDPDREKWLLDLAIIGTVADMVPLKGENRTIVQFGLEILRRTRRPGLEALLSALKLERATLSADDIAFRLAPRLNAAGRMDHPQPALDLLITQDPREADQIVARLESLNRQRQAVTATIIKEVEATVSLDDPIIFAFSPRWRAGVVGLAAGRLADKYDRPAVVVGSNGTHAVGSARSPVTHNVLDLLELGRASLLKLGGHAQAAGFSLAAEMVEEFRERLRGGLASAPTLQEPRTKVDAVVDERLLHEETVRLCEGFAPFGEGNPRPVFLLRNMSLLNWRVVGKSGEHVKFTWDREGDRLDGIGFGLASAMAGVGQGAAVDVVGTLETNEWRGQRTLQVAVRDIAPAGAVAISS